MPVLYLNVWTGKRSGAACEPYSPHPARPAKAQGPKESAVGVARSGNSYSPNRSSILSPSVEASGIRTRYGKARSNRDATNTRRLKMTRNLPQQQPDGWPTTCLEVADHVLQQQFSYGSPALRYLQNVIVEPTKSGKYTSKMNVKKKPANTFLHTDTTRNPIIFIGICRQVTTNRRTRHITSGMWASRILQQQQHATQPGCPPLLPHRHSSSSSSVSASILIDEVLDCDR